MRFATLALCTFTTVYAAACADGPTDVVGPFTGTTHRYVVDGIVLPRSSEEVQAAGDDLDGDGETDNRVGNAIYLLDEGGNVTTHAADMFASGAIASSVEIVADSLDDDESVSVTYHGADSDIAVATGGTFEHGVFASNRTRSTSHAGAATVVLPAFADADPATLQLAEVEMDLEPDGHGGYDLYLRGTTDHDATVAATYASAMEMVAANPTDHLGYMEVFDSMPKDWQISPSEFSDNSLIASLFSADIDGRLSFGMKFHLSPCDAGRCQSSAPADPCHDRLLDGDETDVDCGGSCDLACAGGETCEVISDCQSQHCDSGVCAAPTCTDGVTDGFETGADCGGPCSACM